MSKRSLQCVVTGSKYTFGKDYYNKKGEEYDGDENIKRFFITKKAKTYLNKGYYVQEIRNILDISDTGLPEPDSQDIRDLIDFHKLRNNSTRKKITNTLNFATHKSDDSVTRFINNIKDFEGS